MRTDNKFFLFTIDRRRDILYIYHRNPRITTKAGVLEIYMYGDLGKVHFWYQNFLYSTQVLSYHVVLAYTWVLYAGFYGIAVE